MEEMPTNTEYILRMVLELIDKCETLEELRESVKNVLNESKQKKGQRLLAKTADPTPRKAAGSLTPAAFLYNSLNQKTQAFKIP